MTSKKLMPATIECAVCTKFGDYLCERCGETYCSKYCQVSDWREHRRFCMPIPRLLQRASIDAQSNGNFPAAPMLMDAPASFDAIDAIGSASDHSAKNDSTQLTQENVMKLSKELNKMQIEGNHARIEMKSNMPEIEEVSTPTTATQVPSVSSTVPANAKTQRPKTSVDINANVSVQSEVKSIETPKQSVVLVPPPKKQQSFSPSVKSIQSQTNVTIVHVDKHDVVYVVPTAELAKWKKVVNDINDYAKEAENLKRQPEIGFIILAKSKISDLFLRGIVTKIRSTDEIAKVEFLEYGFTDIVKFAEMKSLPENLVNECRLVNRIELAGAAKEEANADEIKRFLTGLQKNETDLIAKNLELNEKTATSAHFTGTLLDPESFVAINDKIKHLVEVEPQPIVEMEEITDAQDSDIERKKFSGKNMELIILDNSLLKIGCFSAIQPSDMQLLLKNDSLLNGKAESLASGHPFHPRNGEYCLAQLSEDDRWYRATNHGKVNDNTYNLFYVDYGNIEEVPVERIREMRSEFMYPCVTAMCFIDGLGEAGPSKEATERLKKLIIPCSTLTFDDVQSGEEDTIVKSNEILKILKSENLI